MTSDEAHLLHMEQTMRTIDKILESPKVKLSVGSPGGPTPSEIQSPDTKGCPLQEINIGRDFTLRREGDQIVFIDARRRLVDTWMGMNPDQARDIAAALWSLAGEVQP